jgi:hypothetical protein
MDHAARVAFRFLLTIGAIVCFILGLMGVHPLGPDGGTTTSLGLAFVAIVVFMNGSVE